MKGCDVITALDAPTAELSSGERSFVGNVREHGWVTTGVAADDEGPGFSYTTGFWVSAGQPEMIIFSLRDDIAHDVFWSLFRDAKSGAELPVGRRLEEVFGNAPAYVFRVAKKHYANLLGWSRWFYGGDDFPCLQVVWPDPGGRFPWDSGFDATFKADQPDLTEHGWVHEIVQ